MVGRYLRMWLDLDVVFGNKALAAIQLSLVPVLVIFHVEDLSWERSREPSAWLQSSWDRSQVGPPPLPQAPQPPQKPQKTGGSDKGDILRECLGAPVQSWLLPPALLSSQQMWMIHAAGKLPPNFCPGKRVKSISGTSRGGSRPPVSSPGRWQLGGSWEEASWCEQGR